ncbi:hypothetical protein V3C99_012180 [Haemonchus contortus]|uniref:Uncharacterized protein n=1 Tax=Haemonchus contortus TaxID=6289 RepID=A0A7I4Y613_HAECO
MSSEKRDGDFHRTKPHLENFKEALPPLPTPDPLYNDMIKCSVKLYMYIVELIDNISSDTAYLLDNNDSWPVLAQPNATTTSNPDGPTKISETDHDEKGNTEESNEIERVRNNIDHMESVDEQDEGNFERNNEDEYEDQEANNELDESEILKEIDDLEKELEEVYYRIRDLLRMRTCMSLSTTRPRGKTIDTRGSDPTLSHACMKPCLTRVKKTYLISALTKQLWDISTNPASIKIHN